MFQSLLDALLAAFKAISEFVLDQVEGWIPFDLEDIDLLDKLDFVADSVGLVNEVVPMVTCLSILLAGVGAKWSIRAARFAAGFILGVHG